MKKSLILISVLGLAACTTATKVGEAPAVPGQFDFVVKDRNPETIPTWAQDFTKWRLSNENHGQSYYLGESGDVSDRISGCEIAELSAKRKIAQQIAELISSKIGSVKQGRLLVDPNNPTDSGLKKAFDDMMAGRSMAYLSGVKEYATFWELRDYSISNGNKRVFNCEAVVSISDKDYQAALLKSIGSAQEIIEDPDAKAALAEETKVLDKDFRTYQAKMNDTKDE